MKDSCPIVLDVGDQTCVYIDEGYTDKATVYEFHGKVPRHFRKAREQMQRTKVRMWFDIEKGEQ